MVDLRRRDGPDVLREAGSRRSACWPCLNPDSHQARTTPSGPAEFPAAAAPCNRSWSAMDGKSFRSSVGGPPCIRRTCRLPRVKKRSARGIRAPPVFGNKLARARGAIDARQSAKSGIRTICLCTSQRSRVGAEDCRRRGPLADLRPLETGPPAPFPQGPVDVWSRSLRLRDSLFSRAA